MQELQTIRNDAMLIQAETDNPQVAALSSLVAELALKLMDVEAVAEHADSLKSTDVAVPILALTDDTILAQSPACL